MSNNHTTIIAPDALCNCSAADRCILGKTGSQHLCSYTEVEAYVIKKFTSVNPYRLINYIQLFCNTQDDCEPCTYPGCACLHTHCRNLVNSVKALVTAIDKEHEDVKPS